MPSIKEYNDKIRSLGNTRKITRTMKMVSASKLRRAHEAQANAKLYADKLKNLALRITASIDATHHPLMEKQEGVRKILILVITSDKGLCGAFNNNANKMVANWIRENAHHEQIDISCCGKRGYMFFKKTETIKNHYDDVTINPKFENAKQIGADLARDFTAGNYDEIYISYNQFFSPLHQETIFEKILPIDPAALIETAEEHAAEYVFEPDAIQLCDFLIPHYLYFRIYFALLENSAGEHGARMSAMDNATKNASELIENNTLLRNRARQAQITTELTEIVAGKEALE